MSEVSDVLPEHVTDHCGSRDASTVEATAPLTPYDAGLLSDFGGGNVSWWQDYIRSELGAAHDHYQAQIDDRQPLKGSEAVAAEILAERQRQVRGWGWSPEHDDLYLHHELVRAAETYLEAGRLTAQTEAAHTRLLSRWPWAASWFKPRDARRNLIKAAALIVAEIERIDRAAIAKALGEGQ